MSHGKAESRSIYTLPISLTRIADVHMGPFPFFYTWVVISRVSVGLRVSTIIPQVQRKQVKFIEARNNSVLTNAAGQTALASC